MARRRRGKRNGGGPIIQEFEEWSAKGCKCSDKNQGWVEGSLGKAQIMSRGTAGDYRRWNSTAQEQAIWPPISVMLTKIN